MAAKVIGCSTSRMNYLENGRTVQKPEDVRALMQFYSAPGSDGERLAALVEEPARRTWWAPWEPVIPDHFRLFVGLEGFAASQFTYVSLVLPGLLQTASYAASLVGVGQQGSAPPSRDRIVAFRQARQQRLSMTDTPLRLAVVVEEGALGRQVGGTDAMREQLRHLLVMAARDNVNVQVMPRSVAVHEGIGGDFTLLDFSAAQSIGFLGYPDGSVYISDYHGVAGYLYRKDQLQAAALDEHRSKELIEAYLEA